MRRSEFGIRRLNDARLRLERVGVLLRDARKERDAYVLGRVSAITSGERIRPVPATAETLSRLQSAVDYAAAIEEAFEEQVAAAKRKLEEVRASEPVPPRAA